MSILSTAEQVGIGHPDKFCDRVSDTLLTHVIQEDPEAHCAIETMAKGNTVVVAGEVSTEATEMVSLEHVEKVVSKLWESTYNSTNGLNIINLLEKQSPEIEEAVDYGGAGDQGIMVGYAVDSPETNYLPREYYLATDLAKEANQKGIGVLGLDLKTQVTLDQKGNLDHVVFSSQKLEGVENETFYDEMYDIAWNWFNKNNLEVHNEDALERVLSINPGGMWTIGGPEADSGLTGRKIIADAYGPFVPQGGGCWSGKDFTKVDRSGAYMARVIAKSLVINSGMPEATVQLAYEIGSLYPVSVQVWSQGVPQYTLGREIARKIDLTPEGIKELLGLDKVKYSDYCVFGHFTHETAPWETTQIFI